MIFSEQTRIRLAVLKAIRRAGPVARSQLPAMTGLSAGTISSVTADFLERNLIAEEREAGATRGRPRSYLTINAGGAVVAAATIVGIGQLAVSLVDLSGRLLHASRVAIDQPEHTLPAMALAITRALRQAIADSPFDAADLSRIGLALPAIVDTRTGTVLFMATMPRTPTPFASVIEQALGVPVTIENDMTVMARAEHWFGRAQDLDTFTLVAFDFALGSARYIDGLPWTGANGISPEVGHMKIATGPDARPCYCGARGCISAYGSMFGMLQGAGLLDDIAFPPVDHLTDRFGAFVARAEAGDAESLKHLRDGAEKLGVAVANHVNAADPGNVLVLLPPGGMRALAIQPFRDALEANVMPGMMESVAITLGETDPEWRWKGAAALALEQLYLSGS
jgi:predicted NBD/HSP70 family sugar kinase